MFSSKRRGTVPPVGARFTAGVVTCLAALAPPICSAATSPAPLAAVRARQHVTTIRVLDNGAAQMPGVFIETEYVAPHGRPSSKLHKLGLREAVNGRYAFNEALTYLKESPRAAQLLGRIERSGEMISVVINHQCRDDQRMIMGGNSLIIWDPGCAYRIGAGSDSPALVLLHELVHTLHLSENPQAFLDNSSTKNARFNTGEERRTIVYGEIPVARELGEAVRTDHHENRPFRVNDPTVR